MGKGRTSNLARRPIFIYLVRYLFLEKFTHVLDWRDKEKFEFFVLFLNKRNGSFDESYLELFKALDNINPIKGAKYRQRPDYDKDCKKRFKSNLQKLCSDGVIEFIDAEKVIKNQSIEKYYYKFTSKSQNQVVEEMERLEMSMNCDVPSMKNAWIEEVTKNFQSNSTVEKNLNFCGSLNFQTQKTTETTICDDTCKKYVEIDHVPENIFKSSMEKTPNFCGISPVPAEETTLTTICDDTWKENVGNDHVPENMIFNSSMEKTSNFCGIPPVPAEAITFTTKCDDTWKKNVGIDHIPENIFKSSMEKTTNFCGISPVPAEEIITTICYDTWKKYVEIDHVPENMILKSSMEKTSNFYGISPVPAEEITYTTICDDTWKKNVEIDHVPENMRFKSSMEKTSNFCGILPVPAEEIIILEPELPEEERSYKIIVDSGKIILVPVVPVVDQIDAVSIQPVEVSYPIDSGNQSSSLETSTANELNLVSYTDCNENQSNATDLREQNTLDTLFANGTPMDLFMDVDKFNPMKDDILEDSEKNTNSSMNLVGGDFHNSNYGCLTHLGISDERRLEPLPNEF